MSRVLILGGYGTFGGRLAELLADEPRLTLMIAGRSRAKAEAFSGRLKAAAACVPFAFDRDGDVERQLRESDADIVVDATGPFQAFRDDPYRVVKAALALGVNYLDLADAPDFVRSIAQFDDAARRRGVFLLSGVSSLPVLTAAVVRHLAKGMAKVETITGGIAPSPFANVGINVIRAIASYAGKPVAMLHDGRNVTRHALISARRFTVAPPGALPLRPIRFSLVDVPDLQLLPDLWPGLRSVWIGAGPVPAIWHRMLSALSWLVRLRLLPSLVPFAGLMHWANRALAWGEHRGGMFVAVAGRDASGERVERVWYLVAEKEAGPLIPSMAAEAIIRHCLAGRTPPAGARPAVTELELADYEPLLARKAIVTGIRQSLRAGERAPVHRRILGDAYDRLPEPLRVMHDIDRDRTAEGVATVERGTSVLSRLAAWIIGFPPAGTDVPVKVTFRVRDGGEIWRRNFAGREFESVQEEGSGGNERLLCERFGPLTFAMALVLDGDRLRLVTRRWSVFGIPLPLALAPRSNAYECAEQGHFRFHVEISHPFTGPIVTYRGWLVPNP